MLQLVLLQLGFRLAGMSFNGARVGTRPKSRNTRFNQADSDRSKGGTERKVSQEDGVDGDGRYEYAAILCHLAR